MSTHTPHTQASSPHLHGGVLPLLVPRLPQAVPAAQPCPPPPRDGSLGRPSRPPPPGRRRRSLSLLLQRLVLVPPPLQVVVVVVVGMLVATSCQVPAALALMTAVTMSVRVRDALLLLLLAAAALGDLGRRLRRAATAGSPLGPPGA